MRRWLDRPEVKRGGTGTDYASLVAWVKQRISNLDDTLDPSHIDGDLRAKKLFPEVDDLADPLGGKPPPASVGPSSAASRSNAIAT